MTIESQPSQPNATTNAPAPADAGDAADRIMSMANAPDRYALEPSNFAEARVLAHIVAKAGICKVTDEDTAFIIIQTGRELGLTAMQSMRAIYVIDGRPSLYADTMVALVHRSGLCDTFEVVHSDALRCTVHARRKGSNAAPRVFEWTIEQANAIIMKTEKGEKPLTSKDVWKNNPRQMLRHRAEAEAARDVWPDVILGLYTPEEIASSIDNIFAMANTPATNAREVRETVSLKPAAVAKPTMTMTPASAAPTAQAAPAAQVAPSPVASSPMRITLDAPAGADPLAELFAEWSTRLDACTTQATLDALVPTCPVPLRVRLMPRLNAAKERIRAAVAAAPPASAAPVEVSGLEIVNEWQANIATVGPPDEVRAFHVQWIAQVPEPLRPDCVGVTERWLSRNGIADPRAFLASVPS